MTQYGMVIDVKRCIACSTCVVGCKVENNLPQDMWWNKVVNEGGANPDSPAGTYGGEMSMSSYTLSCQHCDKPACVAVCATGATWKDEETGIVWTDHEVCIGCKTCQTVCPYDAPTYDDEAGYMLKCDMCKAELEAGGSKPLCVTGCPMRALDFGTREDIIAQYGEGDIEVEPLPKDTTHPNLIMNPHRDAQKSGSGTGALVNLEEEI